MSDTHEVEVRRIAMLRFGAYAVVLASLMGLGLFFAAGVRSAESWSWFALMSLGGIVGAVWSIRRALGGAGFFGRARSRRGSFGPTVEDRAG